MLAVHVADSVRLKNLPKLGIAAGATQFVDLVPTGASSDSPCRPLDRRVKPGDDKYLTESTSYVMPGPDPGIQARVEHLARWY
jgi:hypothetical protein